MAAGLTVVKIALYGHGVGRHPLLAIALATSALAHPARGDVQFAAPQDPVFRALYPGLDPRTGFTPVAEPEVAKGRATPREPGTGECQPGFRIAEPRTRDWGPYMLAAFLVTTDSMPGVAAPCYRPEPWICVLDKERDGVLQPVDCLRVEQDVFPEELSLDTARYDLNEAERAFGVRFRSEIAFRWGSEIDSALVLFRLHERRLGQILAVRMGSAVDDFDQGAACSSELVLGVARARTAGFFDWIIRVGENTGPGKCEIPDDPVGTYRWDGKRYVKAARGSAQK